MSYGARVDMMRYKASQFYDDIVGSLKKIDDIVGSLKIENPVIVF